MIGRRAALQMLGGIAMGCANGARSSDSTTFRRIGATPESDRPAPAPSAETSASASSAPEEALPPYPADSPIELLSDGELALHDWTVAGHRVVVLVPRHLDRRARVPLLILLHGKAETVDETTGAYAWVRRYGVAHGYRHLRKPGAISVESLGKMATPERVEELQGALARAPFGGMVIACPYTPDHWGSVAFDGAKGAGAIVDAHGRWIFGELLTELRKKTPVRATSAATGLDGVSLGGFSSLVMGAAHAEELGSLGCVQPAIGAGEAERFAKSLHAATEKRAGPALALHLLTSTEDAFRDATLALDRALTRQRVDHRLRVAIGPHDQPFLRGPGSLEMLHFHARSLNA